jgi:hypothetical protein
VSTHRALSILVAGAAPGLADPAVRADEVYANLTTRIGTVHPFLAQGQANSEEHGNTVTLGGTARVVSQVAVRLRIGDFGPATFQLRARLYANDGPGGTPGTRLWQSAPIGQVTDSGSDTTHTLAVPNIPVPGSLTWTIQITDRQISQAPLGPPHFNPPTIGAAAFGFWRRTGPGPADWELTGLAEPPFGARISAVACRADWDHNGAVNPADVAAMVNSWSIGLGNGQLTGDFDASGASEPSDVAAFVAAWFADVSAGCGT